MGDFKYNRYNDLVSAIPKGSFYEGAGIVVPFRGKSPTQMRLETSSPNTAYGLFFNEILVGEVTSDANGNIVFSKVLPLGEVEIALLNKTNGRYQYTYVTTRDYAIWLAGHAEALETIDENIQLLRDNMAIATAEAEALRDVYGVPVKTYNDIGLSNDSYRWMLHELRLGYRNFGGYYKGLDTAISAFTQVSPLSYARRMWGPNWFLNHTMLLNNNFLNRSHEVSYNTTTITGVTLDRVEPDCMAVTASPNVLAFNATAGTLQWQPDGDATASTVVVTDGELFLPGPPSTVATYILGLVGPFSIIAGTNDKLYLNFDNLGTQVVTLTAGAHTPTTIAGEINAAIAPLTRAYVHGTTGGLLLESGATAGSSILIEPGSYNAALDLFGSVSRNFVFDTVGSEGVAAVKLEGAALQLGTGTIQFNYNYASDPIVRRFRWKSATGAYGAYVNFVETGNYELIDTLFTTCTIHAIEEDLYVTTGSGTRTYNLEYNYSAYSDNDYETKGLWVNVDTSLLPAINTSVQVLVSDDTDETPTEDIDTPDYWIVDSYGVGDTHQFLPSVVSDGRDSSIEPCQSFAYRYTGTNSSVDFISRVRQYPLTENLPRGSASPNIGGPGGVYDYEGYDLVFSGYMRNLTSGSLDATLSISFDGGDSWVPMAAPVAITVDDTDGQVPPTYISFEYQIPSNVSISTTNYKDSGIMVKVNADIGVSTAMDVILEGFTAEVKYISSRSLNNATIARSRHRQYFGELIYIWSPDPLTTIEKSYIGLPYALSDRRVPISGVEITDVDPDSPTGSGVFEYEYNSAVPTYRLRWTPNGTSWAPGFGWVPATGDGSLTITAPDATTLTTNITFSLLPILSGTAPVVKSTNLTISSSRSQQGHSRTISPAHSSIDIFDVTEYDTNGDPINLKGVITEADFSLCTLLNMEISSAQPFRYSYLSPTVTNVSGEVLSFVVSGGDFDADLDYDSDQDYLTTVIYEDGIPLPNDTVNNWLYVDSNTVRVRGAAFNSTATYTIDYRPICRVTSDFMGIGATRTDYAWWADYTLWERYESTKGEFEATVPVFFNLNTGRAYLDRRSTKDTSTSRLYVVSGNRQDERTIPKRYWSFVDDFTISIDVSQLQAGQFFLTHNEKRVYEEEFLNVVFEHRSGSTIGNCTAAPWVEVAKNESVSGINLVHQFRMTISNMADIRDFRLRSMCIKGLRLHGSTPSVPSMTSLWS